MDRATGNSDIPSGNRPYNIRLLHICDDAMDSIYRSERMGSACRWRSRCYLVPNETRSGHVKRQEYFALLVVVVLLVVPPYIPWQRLRLREGNKKRLVPTSLAQKRERDHAHDDLTGMTLSNDLTVPASAATASVSIPIDRPYRVGQVTTTWGSKTIISNRSDGIDVAFDSPAPPTGGKLHYS